MMIISKNIGNNRNYQDIMLHIVLQVAVNVRIGPLGVPVVLHVAWALRQGGEHAAEQHKQNTDNAPFHHVLVCFLYP